MLLVTTIFLTSASSAYLRTLSVPEMALCSYKEMSEQATTCTFSKPSKSRQRECLIEEWASQRARGRRHLRIKSTSPELNIVYVPINEKGSDRPLNASVKSDVARSSTTTTSNSASRLSNTERRYPALADRTVL